jgi:tRNA (guanine37-N1)-methyltransferase
MDAPLQIDVVTPIPGMLDGFIGESIIGRAVNASAVRIRRINPRDFTSDVHRTVDDRPYGGGPGMVMKPEPIVDAVESVQTPDSKVLLMSPRGRLFRQADARAWAEERHLILVAGHYEGVDERVRELVVNDEISIGDYVLTNGVVAAAVIIDAVVRLLPGVLGAGPEAHQSDSFSRDLLEYPQYTRPPAFRGLEVPEILRSGNHEAVARWRAEMARQHTLRQRPDLLKDV